MPGNLRHDVMFAWFPGYPAAIDTLSWIPGVGADRAALTVTLAAGLAAAWGLARLGLALTGDQRISLLMVALWAVAPGSLVWTMLYSEALFCALAVWSLVALVERHWLTAAGLTILAGTVRSTAIALVAAVAVAALPPVIRAVRTGQPAGAWWRPAVAVLAAPLGLVGYWAYSAWATHHLAGFMWVESNAHNSWDFGAGIFQSAKLVIMSTPTAFVVLTLLVSPRPSRSPAAAWPNAFPSTCTPIPCWSSCWPSVPARSTWAPSPVSCCPRCCSPSRSPGCWPTPGSGS